MGRPVPPAWRGGHGRPILTPTPLTAPHPDSCGAADHQGPGAAPLGAGPDRLPARPAPLDGSPGLGPLPTGSSGLAGPGNRTRSAPLRTRPARRTGARGHQKARQDPDGGGRRMLGRTRGNRNNQRHPGPRTIHGNAVVGYHYLHTAIDDHSRLAYSELLPDETGATAAAFWTRARTWFTSCGITVERVLTDNGSGHRRRRAGTTVTSPVPPCWRWTRPTTCPPERPP